MYYWLVHPPLLFLDLLDLVRDMSPWQQLDTTKRKYGLFMNVCFQHTFTKCNLISFYVNKITFFSTKKSNQKREAYNLLYTKSSYMEFPTMHLKINKIDDVGSNIFLRVSALNLFHNTYRDIRELGKIIPSPG